jgi:gliding motility-associated-like protein
MGNTSTGEPLPDCTVDIYNRLGQQVFHSVGYAKPWDGKYNGLDQPVATYYYVIKARSDLAPVSGSVTIVR